MATPYPPQQPAAHGQIQAPSGPAVQYIMVNPGQQQPAVRPALKVVYSGKHINSVKWLTISQLLLGTTIFILHVVTTAINDHFINEVSMIRDRLAYGLSYWGGLVDHAATGVWFGVLVIIAASVGICGYRKQRKGLIITHLVLNVLILLAISSLIGTLSATIEALNGCRGRGRSYQRNGYGRNYNRYGFPTTTPAPFNFFGETFSEVYGYFHCSHVTFKVWLALDCIILVSTIVLIFLTLTLLIYNCIATCRCCRRTGCCGRCCGKSSCCYGSPDDDVSVPVVSYHAQSAPMLVSHSTAAGQPQFVPQPQFAPQPQFNPQLYAQPVPMYAQQMMMPGMAAYGQPAMGVASHNAPSAATDVNQASRGADRPEEKWEDLPPGYSEINQQGGQ